jgi:hypothetical protein
VFPDSSETITFFCDLFEPYKTFASAIFYSMLSCLHKRVFTREYLLRDLISFAGDGAGSMSGKTKGVAAQFVEKFPRS